MVLPTKQLDFKAAKKNREQLKRERRGQKLRKKYTCPMIASLEKAFNYASAEDVVQILMNEFYLNWSEITFGSGRKMTLEDISKVVKNQNISAASISPITFDGGPPNMPVTQFSGSLLTMLFDRIMYQNTFNGKYADLVNG